SERGMAVLAHLSGLSGYLVPLGGVLVPLILYFVMKDESRPVARIALQALLLNVATWIAIALFGVGVLTGVIGIALVESPDASILAILGMLVLVVAFVLVVVAALVLPIVGAIKASRGQYYRYPLIGLSPS